jgi:hypothetical protein
MKTDFESHNPNINPIDTLKLFNEILGIVSRGVGSSTRLDFFKIGRIYNEEDTDELIKVIWKLNDDVRQKLQSKEDIYVQVHYMKSSYYTDDSELIEISLVYPKTVKIQEFTTI